MRGCPYDYIRCWKNYFSGPPTVGKLPHNLRCLKQIVISFHEVGVPRVRESQSGPCKKQKGPSCPEPSWPGIGAEGAKGGTHKQICSEKGCLLKFMLRPSHHKEGALQASTCEHAPAFSQMSLGTGIATTSHIAVLKVCTMRPRLEGMYLPALKSCEDPLLHTLERLLRTMYTMA